MPIRVFSKRRFAGAVAAEQRDDLVLAHVERDRIEDVALAVERIDPSIASSVLGAGRGGARLGGDVRGAGADIDLAHLGVVARVSTVPSTSTRALVHHRDVVGDLEHPVDVVLDQQDGDLGGHRFHQRGDALPLGRREAGQRLVEQQDARPRRQREPHVEQALPAIGERGRLGALDAGEAEIGRSTRSFRP